MQYSLNFKKMDRILKKHGYHLEEIEFVGGNYTERYGIHKYKNIDNNCKLELVRDNYNQELIGYGKFINGKEEKGFYNARETEEVLSKLPFKKVYTYSVNSSNFWRINSIYKYMVKKNISIFDKDVMEKLHGRWGFKELIDYIEESYSNETPLAKLAIFCKLSCMRSQNFRLSILPPFSRTKESRPDVEYERRRLELLNINKDLPKDYSSLHMLMIYYYRSWKSSWKNLRALGRMFHPMIRIRKEDVIFSDRVNSLLSKDPNMDPTIAESTYNPETKKYEERLLKDVCPWLFKEECLPQIKREGTFNMD